MRWRDVYTNSIANQSPDPSQYAVLSKPRLIAKSARPDEPPFTDHDIEADELAEEDADDACDEEGVADEPDEEFGSLNSPSSSLLSDTFNVGEHIDIRSPFLLDLLSDTAVHSKPPDQPARSSTKRPNGSSTTSVPLKANEWF